ncbi:MAG: IS110 family transposase [Gemmatimonadota bacterium]|nr:IS110 family transposase [Gemmatimonadota bacterium]
MDTIGLDLHKRETQLCIISDGGSISERRIVTSRERLAAVLASCSPARILLEASTESEWVAQHLESLGHEVIVADPNYAPMYGSRTRRVKTDKRDARALAEALRLGAYRVAHRVSPERRHVRAELAVREALVRTRTRYVSLAKALVRRDGLRVAGSESHLVAKRIAALDLSDALASELMPLFQVLVPINEQIAAADGRIGSLTDDDPDVALLTTAPSIGPITAAAIVATVDDITRFHSAHQFEAFLGLVPGERSSGEKRRVGKITKAGNSRVRYLLVEAGWRIMRSRSEETAALRAWALLIAARRGKRIAVVALARRLAGILYAMWRDDSPYNTANLRMPRPILAKAS